MLLGSSGAHFPAPSQPTSSGMFQLYIILLQRCVCWGQDNTAVKTDVSGSDTIPGDKREPAGAPTLHLGSQNKESFSMQ